MIDYWNDAPEIAETPECCGEFMEIDDLGVCRCLSCKAELHPQPDPEPVPEPEPDPVEPVLLAVCPHGRVISCERCDYLADLAFDAAREARLRR